MALVTRNAIIEKVNISRGGKENNKLCICLHIKRRSDAVTIDLDNETLLNLFKVCGNRNSLEEIKDVPIRLLSIKKEKRETTVAVGDIISNKWLLFDTCELRNSNYLKTYFGVTEIIMDDY